MGLGKKLLKTSPVGFAAVKSAERKEAKAAERNDDPERLHDQTKQDRQLASETKARANEDPHLAKAVSPPALRLPQRLP